MPPEHASDSLVHRIDIGRNKRVLPLGVMPVRRSLVVFSLSWQCRKDPVNRHTVQNRISAAESPTRTGLRSTGPSPSRFAVRACPAEFPNFHVAVLRGNPPEVLPSGTEL